MLNLLERGIAHIHRRLLLLAPPNASARGFFRNVTVDSDLHESFVERMQRLRGEVYLQDGAIAASQLSADGLHRTPEDDDSWHLLMLGPGYEISACVWYLEHENTASIEQMRVRHCPLFTQLESRPVFRRAIEAELARARQGDMRYAEIGGWAVSPGSRCTAEGLILALAAYGMGRIAGGALGLTTATVRHGSAAILRRLGGSPLLADALPVQAYYDSRYGCDMELLRFDSRRPSPKFAPLVDSLTDRLQHVPILAAGPLADPLEVQEVAASPESLFAA